MTAPSSAAAPAGETLATAAAGDSPAAEVGARLRQAREAAGLPIGELAARLHLSVRQVEALERGDLDALPGMTFVRGFVRNHARAVDLDPAPLLARLDGLRARSQPELDLPVSMHVAMPDPNRRLKRDALIVLAGLALVLAAGAAYFFLPDHFWVRRPDAAPAALAQPAPAEVASPGESASTTPPAPVPAVASEAAASAGNAPIASSSIAAAPASSSPPGDPAAASASAAPNGPQPSLPPAPPAAQAAVAAPAAGSATLRFAFARDSWVEVRDREGNLLLSRLNPAGSQKEISGRPPFSVVVGNASHVKLQYQGQDVALSPNGESDVARLTLP